MKTPFHSSSNAKSVNEERCGSFGAMIFWNDVRRLVLKMAESERIDALAGPLTIVEFFGSGSNGGLEGNDWGVCATCARVMVYAGVYQGPTRGIRGQRARKRT